MWATLGAGRFYSGFWPIFRYLSIVIKIGRLLERMRATNVKYLAKRLTNLTSLKTIQLSYFKIQKHRNSVFLA